MSLYLYKYRTRLESFSILDTSSRPGYSRTTPSRRPWSLPLRRVLYSLPHPPQPPQIPNPIPLPAHLHNPLLLPLLERPAHREKGGAGDLGYLLLGDPFDRHRPSSSLRPIWPARRRRVLARRWATGSVASSRTRLRASRVWAETMRRTLASKRGWWRTMSRRASRLQARTCPDPTQPPARSVGSMIARSRKYRR